MARVLLACGLVAMLTACGGGTAGEVAAPEVIDFKAAVEVSPTQPVAGRRVSFTLELKSGCNKRQETDIVLRVESQDGTRVMYQETWDAVDFDPAEVWNLTQGFVADTDPGKQTWRVRIVVKDHGTGLVLHEEDAARVNFTGTAL
ncbi:MAG: hypothetical protein K1X89_17965 [Myxococcaceae bacterium]|nr:hypothetical protein [Myxococcaceae bacterium]